MRRIWILWVAFVIMPVFALVNAGVWIEPSGFGQPVALAVMTGLVVGKPIGIMLFCWTAVKLGMARMPADINNKILLGAGCLAGIGFTMSLFIAGLAMSGAHLAEAKIGILAGSGIGAALGLQCSGGFCRTPPHPCRAIERIFDAAESRPVITPATLLES